MKCDVVVVGSGAGGGPIAYELAKAGASVIVLEKGPRHEKKDFVHDEISTCRRNFFLPWPDDDPHVVLASPDAKPNRTNAGWISQCVGGGTVHMSGFFFRFHEKDFALSKHYGPLNGSTAIDWPFGYDTLAPYYDKVEKVVGVSGDVSKNPFEPPRSGPFPYDPVLTHPISRWIDEAGDALGLHPFHVPRAIITRPEGDRGACVYHGLCGSYGCEVGAKSSTLASLIPGAEKAGARVLPKSMVREIVMKKDGRAKGVVFEDETGARHEVEAKIVVVACSAIESARLLLLSGSSAHPRGVGNNADQVGRNLCFSTLGQLTGDIAYDGLDDTAKAELKNGMPFIGRAVQDFYEVDPSGDVFGKGGTFHLLFEHDNPIHAAERLIRDKNGLVYGEALMKKLHAHFTERRTLEVECFSEWLPTDGCRVTLDDNATDRWGLPAARITLNRHPSDRAASALLVGRARVLLEKLGATNIRTLDVGGVTYVLQHGTCRMGSDPNTSVTTPAGHLHEVDNVYVTDGGSLPSSGAVPSTMTILANAFRIADGMKSKLAG
ncbi:MAG: GMC family oxidoreductase [Deltaproteobacteria bacterium]|jgi:choline dehydrogenase-like flavoprotein